MIEIDLTPITDFRNIKDRQWQSLVVRTKEVTAIRKWVQDKEFRFIYSPQSGPNQKPSAVIFYNEEDATAFKLKFNLK